MNVIQSVIILVAALFILLGGLFGISILRTDSSSVALQRGHYTHAVKLLRKDADNGDAAALTMLANLHQLGLGVPRRPDKSVSLYSEAAFAGNVAARVNLGHAYSRGEGVPENAELSYAWYNLARNSGSEVAQYYMSELLAEHRLRYNKPASLRLQYATINNFEKLH